MCATYGGWGFADGSLYDGDSHAANVADAVNYWWTGTWSPSHQSSYLFPLCPDNAMQRLFRVAALGIPDLII